MRFIQKASSNLSPFYADISCFKNCSAITNMYMLKICVAIRFVRKKNLKTANVLSVLFTITTFVNKDVFQFLMQ